MSVASNWIQNNTLIHDFQTGKYERLILNQTQKKMLSAMENNQTVVATKKRQVGVTQLMGSYMKFLKQKDPLITIGFICPNRNTPKLIKSMSSDSVDKYIYSSADFRSWKFDYLFADEILFAPRFEELMEYLTHSPEFFKNIIMCSSVETATDIRLDEKLIKNYSRFLTRRGNILIQDLTT